VKRRPHGSPADFYRAVGVPPALEEAWIRRLHWYFSLYNENYLAGKLRRPLFRIGRAASKLGEWCPRNRSITISQQHILAHPWESVLDTLRHEMAHQYLDEVLEIEGASPHGEAFRRACRLLRCEPTARGSDPGKLEESPAERDKILGRVKELLALASSPNEHEAASAMRMANKYLLKYNLELSELEGARRYATRHLGVCSARVQEYEYTLGAILQDHFFVQVIWTFSYDPLHDTRGRILQISGTPENLEIAEYVYNYVMRLAEPLWREYRRARREGGCTKLQYLAGLVRGFQNKLDRQKEDLKEEQGLIWLGDPGLDEYYRYLNPRVRTSYSSGVRRNQGYSDGFADGGKINVRRGLKGSASSRGRLLPGGG
jgi:hypothetical protein